MRKRNKTYIFPVIFALLFSFVAQCINQGITIQIDPQVANQLEIELLIEKDGESGPGLQPSIVDVIFSFVFIPNIKDEFHDFREFCLDNPPLLLLKVDRTILFRSLKIHI